MSQARFDPDAAPPHPGEILREDILPALGMTRTGLARHLGISVRKLSGVLTERRPLNLDLAVRLGAALGSGTRYWLGLQVQYDLWRAEQSTALVIAPLVWPSRRRHGPAIAA